MERKGMIEGTTLEQVQKIKFSYKAVYENLIQPQLMWWGNGKKVDVTSADGLNHTIPKEVAAFFDEMSDRADKWLDAQVPGVTSKTVSKLAEQENNNDDE